MASKGGGETLSDIGSFLGNAFIPQTMDRFRAMQEAPQRRSAISSLIDSSGIAAADPTASPDSVARPGIEDQVFRNIAPNTDAGKFNTVESFRKATPAFDPAFLQSQIGKMFPAPEEAFTVGENQVRYGSKGQILGRGPAKAPETFKVGSTRDVRRGSQIVTEELQPDGVTWEPIGSGDAFAPTQPKETWSLLSPEQATAKGLPRGGTYEISNQGQTRAVVAPTKEMGPAAMKVAQAKIGSNAILYGLQKFRTAIEEAPEGAQMSALMGGMTPAGQKLNSAWTNAALLAKGEELYNLGVLSGPDLDIIQKALPDPSTKGGALKDKETYYTAIKQVEDLVNQRLKDTQSAFGDDPTAQSPKADSPFKEGATATGTNGQKIVYRGGRWQPVS